MTDYKKMAEQNKLGWEVKAEPLFVNINGEQVETPYRAVYREDTGQIFQSVKKSYSPYQNHELFALADAISEETNLPVHKAIEIDGGAKVVIQLKNTSITDVGKNHDRIDSYVTVLNSHDGSSSLRWGTSRETLSCKNQFYAMARELKNHARHTKNMRIRVDDSVREIQRVLEYQKRLNEKTYELSEHHIGQGAVDQFLEKLIGFDIMAPEELLRIEHHGKKLNRAYAIRDAVESQIAEKGCNLWGLWEGVTYYTTHNAGRTSEYSKINGANNVLDNRALDLVLKMQQV